MSTRASEAGSGANDPYVVLDDEDRIIYVSGPLQEALGRWRGHVIWDHLPHAREVYEPSFGEARSSGEPISTIVFYSGRLKRITAVPAVDGGLVVHVERIAELDVTSLGTLMQSLERIERELAARAYEQPGRRSHASLQALP